MNAVSLRAILARELAAVGIVDRGDLAAHSRPRFMRWSAKQPGFGVRIYRSGKRVYVVQVRMQGVVRTVTICNAAFISEHVALDVARRVILRAQVGENPAEQRKRTRSLPPFDRFLERYWQQASPSWKPSTRVAHDKYRSYHLDGAFAGKTIDAIDTADVTAWYAAVADNAGPGAANRTLDILRAMLNRAEEWGARPPGSNPCRSIRRYKGRKIERHLTQAEFERLGKVLDRQKVERPIHTAAVYLLLLTGCRLSEIINLTWGEVKGHRLKLTDSKTGPRTVWLGEDARAILDQLERGKGADLVFRSPTTGGAINLSFLWTTVRKEAGLGLIRLHDIRHSFASRGAGMCETLPMIGKLLGHSSIKSTARYAHLDDSDATEAAQRIGDLIEAMI
ncbi:site-specific integrase [Sphingobium sp. EM0848]|uniref:tyrosine-type recombinase/integrase n=1 Tax=Sphingobium sp. EM0848 TaxID=2743473 RepID=UPI00159C6D5F|nr:site-specific integrase [Sphingobium sp. EM0848]